MNTKRIMFWFISPRKMRKFCVLRALVKSTISKKIFFLKSMIMNKIFFLKSMILNKKIFVKRMILDRKIFVSSDFVSTFLQRVRFGIKNIITSQILKRKILPNSTTCTFQIVFLHITMYSYRLQYPRELDNSNRLRSKKIFCTLFRRDFHF